MIDKLLFRGFTLFIFLFHFRNVVADSVSIPSLKNVQPENGINPVVYDEFWLKWKLVTVRYRKDNGEQRFIYANESAYNALLNKEVKYPDGAAFGKVAFLTKEDPRFPNSLEPQKFTRIQLMVKDSNRFKERDGWSYFLLAGAEISSENYITSCHACHSIVKDKDFVFSSIAFNGNLDNKNHLVNFKDGFLKKDARERSTYVNGILQIIGKEKEKDAMVQNMPLFSGAIFESIGPLANYAGEDNRIYVLVDERKQIFLVAEPTPGSKECKQRILIYTNLMQQYTKANKKSELRNFKKGIVCDGINEWQK